MGAKIVDDSGSFCKQERNLAHLLNLDVMAVLIEKVPKNPLMIFLINKTETFETFEKRNPPYCLQFLANVTNHLFSSFPHSFFIIV